MVLNTNAPAMQTYEYQALPCERFFHLKTGWTPQKAILGSPPLSETTIWVIILSTVSNHESRQTPVLFPGGKL